MNLALKPALKKFVESQVKSGRYDSPDEVVAAGLARLMQDQGDSGLSDGELQKFVDAGEADIVRGNVFTLKEVRRHFARKRSESPPKGGQVTAKRAPGQSR